MMKGQRSTVSGTKTPQSGLTLVELTVALALAAALAVSAFAALGHLSAADRRERARAEDADLALPIQSLLASDLTHAASAGSIEGGFWVRTLNALDARSMEPAHRPAIVFYLVQEAGDRSWLLRVQHREAGATLTEIVCAGVRSVGLEPVPSEKGPVAEGALPDASRLTLEFSSGRPSLVMTFRRQ